MSTVPFTSETIDACLAGARALRFIKEAAEELATSWDGSAQQAHIDELEEFVTEMRLQRQETIEKNIEQYGSHTVRVDHAPLRAVSGLEDNARHSVKAPDPAVAYQGASFMRREHPFGIGGDQ